MKTFKLKVKKSIEIATQRVNLNPIKKGTFCALCSMRDDQIDNGNN